ncbi:3-oxoacyl-ACP reductase [Burkholderia multivorans]|uniref:SDR family NAD(P)-dependent oxidoreductase n=1 Tax=Burkholderia multivorans TaxID=87883 RepID=UPI000841A24B|nr:glucose 1-dehydrogenase [Burkholderia multivorans]AOJ91575.1 3-oxoacyl-ACP reductase [Burkholderia multivorans]
MKLDSYRNQVISITGAASGFGALLAERLADMGARLVISDRDGAKLEAVAVELGRKTDVVSQVCDVTVEAQVESMVEVAIGRFGRLDVAVNNAGVAGSMKSLIDTTEADLDLSFAVNMKGVFFGLKHQIRRMVPQGGGVILNVASMAGIGAAPKLSAYAAAKHAVVGLTRTAAIEYARHGIRVNAVCPFYSATPLVTESDMREKQDFFAQASPMKRLASPDEVVTAMLMLCAKENGYMNGVALAVDGGISAF